MEKRIAVLRGDGIGPEVVNESIKVLERVAQKFGHTFHYYDIIGGVAGLEAYGDALRPQDYELGRSCDSILFGSVGDPRKYTFTGANGTKKYPSRKEAAVKALASFRRGMELFANIRPAKVYPQLIQASPLKDTVARELGQYRTTATIRITGRPFCKNQLGRPCFCSQERTDSSCQAGSVSQNQIR